MSHPNQFELEVVRGAGSRGGEKIKVYGHHPDHPRRVPIALKANGQWVGCLDHPGRIALMEAVCARPA